jgi:hypothetical protein
MLAVQCYQDFTAALQLDDAVGAALRGRDRGAAGITVRVIIGFLVEVRWPLAGARGFRDHGKARL